MFNLTANASIINGVENISKDIIPDFSFNKLNNTNIAVNNAPKYIPAHLAQTRKGAVPKFISDNSD